MAAYDLVLKGLEYAKKGSVFKENTENAVKLFEEGHKIRTLTYPRALRFRLLFK